MRELNGIDNTSLGLGGGVELDKKKGDTKPVHSQTKGQKTTIFQKKKTNKQNKTAIQHKLTGPTTSEQWETVVPEAAPR